jgi:hypothetical protein
MSGRRKFRDHLLDQNRFGDHRTRATGTCESGDRRNEMDEKYN